MINNKNIKMNWLAEKYNNNECEYKLFNTHAYKGTAVLPTGAGKSGIVYEDILWKIDHAKEGEKIIFNLSAPILRLEEQFMNDFISVLDLISVLQVSHKNAINNGKFMFFVNSSADGNDYDADTMNADVKPFLKDISDFENSKTACFAFVASCHKSLYKFANKVDYLNKFATVVTYLDEAHLVLNNTRDDKKLVKLKDYGKIAWASLKKLCCCKYLYALTATPDYYVTKIINDSAGYSPKHYIINIPATDLIEKNIILAPNICISKSYVDNGEKITLDVCIKFMKYVKGICPNIKHKILVTCRSTNHLKLLRNQLQNTTYKVFSTCAEEGGVQIKENDELININEVDFINEIDNYDDDCFVLHIKQLTQGVDIKSLTDCIFYNESTIQTGVKRIMVQTIGRTLRPLMGERGVCIENRIKKQGNALIVLGEKNYDEYSEQIAAFTYHYYGSKNGTSVFSFDGEVDYGNRGKNKTIRFGNADSWMDDEDAYYQMFIEELRAKMEIYVEQSLLPQYELYKRFMDEETFSHNVKRDIEFIKEKFKHYYGEEYRTDELLGKTEFIQLITETLEKYGINA